MIDQLESDLGKLRTMMKEEMANGSGAKATELYNKAKKCEIELNNYQTRVDEINEEHIRRTSTTSSKNGD
jgi:hypothetical protein